MDLASLLSPELIAVQMEAQDREEAIRRLGNLMVDAGCVERAYVEAVLARERVFPTGLPTEGIQVALPHAEAEHVHTSSLAIGTLKQAVPFQMMGNPAESVNVEIIFLLAIREQSGQVPALQQITRLLQKEETLRHLASAGSKQELYQRLLEHLQAMQVG